MARANSDISMGTWSGSDATRELHQTIREFNEASTRQTSIIVRLTWTLTILTVIMTFLVGVQIWIALR